MGDVVSLSVEVAASVVSFVDDGMTGFVEI